MFNNLVIIKTMKELTSQQKLEILCAYLPHGVEVESPSGSVFILGTYSNMRGSGKEQRSIETAITDNYHPILRHPDDMTDEELIQLGRVLWGDDSHRKEFARNDAKDWLRGTMKPTMSQKTAQKATLYLHSIHIDTFDAIEAGFAVRKNINEKTIMNIEQEIKSIKVNLDRLYSELDVVKGMVLKLAQLPDGMIGNSSDSPYVKSDNPDINHYMPKVGEVVLVAKQSKNFVTRVFTQYDPSSNFPFMTVVNGLAHSECKNYRMGLKYSETEWLFCRRLNGEIIEFGCDKVKQPERNEAEQPNPYTVDWTNAPDWADVHCFDSRGIGHWIGMSDIGKAWESLDRISRHNLPAGLDWRLSKTFRPR